MDFKKLIEEKKLTMAELKKREEIARAMERENPGMDMGKKMAIATAAAKRVAEEVEELEELYKDPDAHFSKQSKQMQDAINLHQRKGKSYWEAVRAAKTHVKEEVEELDETHLPKGTKIKDGEEELTIEKPVGKDKYLVKAKEPVEEQAPVAPTLVKHRIGVRVTDGKTNKRKVKYVVVTHTDNKEGAAKVGEKHFRKKGDFVHGSFHSGMVSEEVEAIDEMTQGKSYSQAQLKKKIESGNWEATQDIKPGKHVEFRHHTGKRVTVHVKEEVEQIDETPKVDQGLSGKQKVAARAERGDNYRPFEVGNTTGGQWRGKTDPSPYKDSKVAKSGERKGLITKSAIQKTKDAIKSRLNTEEVELEESDNYIIHATVDGKTKTFRVRGAASEADAKKKFEQHHATTPIVKVVKEEVELDEANVGDRLGYLTKAEREKELKRRKLAKAAAPSGSKNFVAKALANVKPRTEEVELDEAKKKKACSTIENEHGEIEDEKIEESRQADWARIQQMDKGSVLGDKESLKRRIDYKKAVHDHVKKYGGDTAIHRKEIGKLNAAHVAMKDKK